MREAKDLVNDNRKILQFVKSLGSEMGIYTVGRDKITSIVAYWENGHMAAIPWIAVYKGDEISARMDCTNCIITYDLENS